MNQTYRFEDWTSAAKMRNELNPCLRVDIGVLRDMTNGSVEGYQLTIYDEAVDQIVYRTFIDYGKEGTWSLSTDEAIELLNQIGFNCVYQRPKLELTSQVRTALRAAQSLGYTHVYRRIRPVPEVVFVNGFTGKECSLVILLGDEDYNYHNYWFLDETPVRIDGILSGDTPANE